ncbi:MAG: hypothetical protein O7E52_06295 [Candidatus Poribacteria bacterium]|nr:hypothetical protein [Candidatus Poribacteria bacterium]
MNTLNTHEDRRANIPTAEFRNVVDDENALSKTLDLIPLRGIEWAGKKNSR